MAAVVAAALLLSVAFPVAAQDRPDPLKEKDADLQQMQDRITSATERARELAAEADSLDAEISNLTRQLVSAAEEIRGTEAGVHDTENRLRALDEEERRLARALKTRFQQMAKTLAAMQRLSQQPVALVSVRPGEAIDSLRSATLLRTLQPELKRRAGIIEQDMTALGEVRDEISHERHELRGLLAALTAEQIDMNQLLAERREKHRVLRQATEEERRKLKEFAAKAENLQELIAKIAQERREREAAAAVAARRLAEKPGTGRPATAPESARAKLRNLPNDAVAFAQAKGSMPLPAQGSIHKNFGARTPEGQSSEGITIHTLPQAVVVSPHEGRIVYAGKFRTYGQLLIIAHGQEYHTLLAGMTRLDAEVGQWVLKGEPIGQMAPGSATANANTNAAMAGQSLYVELRRMGKPINPLPWIAARDRKVL